MRRKITRNGLRMEFHCDECFLGECPLFLDITCEDNCKVEPKTFADCGMDMRYTKTTTPTMEEHKSLCGPALLVGLALLPALLERRINGKR